AVDRHPALVGLLEAGVARLLDELGDALHRPVERAVLPAVAVRRAVLDGRDPGGAIQQPERRGALRAERAAVDRAGVVALDVDDPAIPGVDELRAADRAVGADADAGVEAADPGVERAGRPADRVRDHAHVALEATDSLHLTLLRAR